VSTKKVRHSQLRDHLPSDTPVVTAEQRRDEIDSRRRACRRWYGYEPSRVQGP
jgi:tRNA U38,U39,U40 pseudouridine synthase TruA